MIDSASSLRVLLLLGDQALVNAGTAIASALNAHSTAAQGLQDAIAGQRNTAQELERLARSPSINAAAYDAVRQLHAASRERVCGARESLAQQERLLDVARDELGRCRQRQEQIVRRLDQQRGEMRRTERMAEGRTLDDLWLHSTEAMR